MPLHRNCSISLLPWNGVQIKIHFIRWLKSSSKVSSITTLKNITAFYILCLPFESFPWVLFWQPFLLRAKDSVFRKPIPHSLFNMNNSRVIVQFQFSEKLFIHITFSKFITSTEPCYLPMFASIHLHLKKIINLTQNKCRLERKVKVSLSKQNNSLENNPH